jgi:hypothetical protein
MQLSRYSPLAWIMADGEVWDAVALKPLYIIYSTFDIGDVFAVVYSQSLNTIYLGAQNTSIQVLPPPTARQLQTNYSSGMISMKCPLDHVRHPRHFPCAGSINSSIPKRLHLQIKVTSTTMDPGRGSRSLRLNPRIKSVSLIMDTFIVSISGASRIHPNHCSSLVSLGLVLVSLGFFCGF